MLVFLLRKLTFAKEISVRKCASLDTPPVPSHSGMSLGRGTQGTERPALPPPPPPPPFPGLLPNPQVTLPSTSPPLSILGRGFPLCRCVEHTPL